MILVPPRMHISCCNLLLVCSYSVSSCCKTFNFRIPFLLPSSTASKKLGGRWLLSSNTCSIDLCPLLTRYSPNALSAIAPPSNAPYCNCLLSSLWGPCSRRSLTMPQKKEVHNKMEGRSKIFSPVCQVCSESFIAFNSSSTNPPSSNTSRMVKSGYTSLAAIAWFCCGLPLVVGFVHPLGMPLHKNPKLSKSWIRVLLRFLALFTLALHREQTHRLSSVFEYTLQSQCSRSY